MTASHFWVNCFFKIWERKSKKKKKAFHQPFQRQHNYLQPTEVLRMTPATLSVPWSNSNSLPPHSQISEASPSCELTRWSGMGGSDPKDPSLTHPLLLSPRFLKWHLPAIHGDWGKCRTKTMSLVLRGWGSYLFMKILFGFCTGGSFNKAITAQTFRAATLASWTLAHTNPEERW